MNCLGLRGSIFTTLATYIRETHLLHWRPSYCRQQFIPCSCGRWAKFPYQHLQDNVLSASCDCDSCLPRFSIGRNSQINLLFLCQ